jgi:hypothetical protein
VTIPWNLRSLKTTVSLWAMWTKVTRCPHNYSMSRRNWKWTEKLFFHLTHFVIALIIHRSCGVMTHKKFREQLIWDVILLAYDQIITAIGIARGSPSAAATQMSRLEVKHSMHWPVKWTMRHCRVCCSKN